eukprot:4924291-Amphidinium_carterae.1
MFGRNLTNWFHLGVTLPYGWVWDGSAMRRQIKGCLLRVFTIMFGQITSHIAAFVVNKATMHLQN